MEITKKILYTFTVMFMLQIERGERYVYPGQRQTDYP